MLGPERKAITKWVVIFEVVYFCTEFESIHRAFHVENGHYFTLWVDCTGNVEGFTSLFEAQSSGWAILRVKFVVTYKSSSFFDGNQVS
jgi:hypothetical protein